MLAKMGEDYPNNSAGNDINYSNNSLIRFNAENPTKTKLFLRFIIFLSYS
jgi:hypothetical protein